MAFDKALKVVGLYITSISHFAFIIYKFHVFKHEFNITIPMSSVNLIIMSDSAPVYKEALCVQARSFLVF
jgi:hypothetical protein